MLAYYGFKKLREWRRARRAAASSAEAQDADSAEAQEGAASETGSSAGGKSEASREEIGPGSSREFLRASPEAPKRSPAVVRNVVDGAVIEAHELVKRYGSLAAVDRISLSTQAGEIFGLLGPNGAGKTTTLEMLEGLRIPDSGNATVLGLEVTRYPRQIKERIGVQLQATALPPMTTVTEAIELFASFYKKRRPTEDLLREFDLSRKATDMAESLSGGQAQRLSIALALVNDPELVFLDEPTTGLDPQARLNLWDVIEGIQSQGKTVVLTTHYMEEAERLCDRVAVIDHGKIVALDTPERLIATFAPGASIEFSTASPEAPGLGSMPHVERFEVAGERVTLYTRKPERLLAKLFEPDAPWVRAIHTMTDLRVHQGTLEDVFITLTGRTLRA